MTGLQSLQERLDNLVAYRNPNDRPLTIQWTCVCDMDHYVQAINLHAVKCGNCGREFELSTQVRLQPHLGGFTPVVCNGVTDLTELER